jgi:hypothetical protein
VAKDLTERPHGGIGFEGILFLLHLLAGALDAGSCEAANIFCEFKRRRPA